MEISFHALWNARSVSYEISNSLKLSGWKRFQKSTIIGHNWLQFLNSGKFRKFFPHPKCAWFSASDSRLWHSLRNGMRAITVRPGWQVAWHSQSDWRRQPVILMFQFDIRLWYSEDRPFILLVISSLFSCPFYGATSTNSVSPHKRSPRFQHQSSELKWLAKVTDWSKGPE